MVSVSLNGLLHGLRKYRKKNEKDGHEDRSLLSDQEIREVPDGAPEASEQAMAIPDAIPLLDKAKDPAKESISEVPAPQLEQKENLPAKA